MERPQKVPGSQSPASDGAGLGPGPLTSSGPCRTLLCSLCWLSTLTVLSRESANQDATAHSPFCLKFCSVPPLLWLPTGAFGSSCLARWLQLAAQGRRLVLLNPVNGVGGPCIPTALERGGVSLGRRQEGGRGWCEGEGDRGSGQWRMKAERSQDQCPGPV